MRLEGVPMRVDLAQFAITLLYVLPGAAFLLFARVIAATPRQLFAALGLAYLCGVAIVMLSAILLLVIGVPMSAPVYLVIALALTAAFLVPALRRSETLVGWHPPRLSWKSFREWLGARTPAWWIAALTLFVLGVMVLVGYMSAVKLPVVGWDGWSIWLRKGLVLFDSGSLPTEFFTSAKYEYMHADYPILLPLWESAFFRFAGAADVQALHGQFWIMFVAGLWAGAFLAHRIAAAVDGSKEWAAALWAPALGLLLVTATVRVQLMTMYADIPLAIFAFAAVLAFSLWLADGRSGYLWTGAVLLSAVASLKNEGLTTAAAVLGALVLIRFFAPGSSSRIQSAKPALVASAAVVITTLPWRIWIKLQDISGDLPVGQGLSPSFLWERRSRVRPTWEAIIEQLTNAGFWNLIPALAVGLILFCLLAGVGRRIAGFYLFALVGTMAAIVWAYWISPLELDWHLRTSVDRTIAGFIMICAAAALNLILVLASAGLGDTDADQVESSAAANAPPPHD